MEKQIEKKQKTMKSIKNNKKEKILRKRELLFEKIQAPEKLDKNKLLEVKNLHVSFPVGRKKTIHIVRGVDLVVKRGEIVGLVGESGSGKSVTSKTLINVNENGIVSADKIQIDNLELSSILKKEKHWQLVRGQKIGYIPQDPLTSLNPTRTIGKQLLDALNNNPDWIDKTYTEKKEYLLGLLKTFGLRDVEKIFGTYPHTLSGGMKQRIVITMVVALKPDLIIADEPTTALDPTVQASVLALFENIRQEMGISIILISHNISVIAKFCDYIYVMYAGRIVERGLKEEIFTAPAHPYTWALISAIPESKEEKLYNIKGTPPDMANLPVGDPFAPRNDYALEIDFIKEPPLIPITETHYAATWLLSPNAPKIELSKDLQKRLDLFKKAFNNETDK
ncbi:Oligopeptide ABC transporter, ATP-binding protein [Metamycoplasma auris 15026]|uniref:Oligopeptide ABC transporter, ATP-binding protein n=1 Tax=Metamycoplasma auris 15026 TaxID=1188233 RepID=N9V9W8_9BACT|nr:ABC transporter ATP-binding protein [Metamycoplasma auris]ENY68493.1 Oligopeptide ABC transporter, ATP-binding protein [Metamycoplasma auris 15026]